MNTKPEDESHLCIGKVEVREGTALLAHQHCVTIKHDRPWPDWYRECILYYVKAHTQYLKALQKP